MKRLIILTFLLAFVAVSFDTSAKVTPKDVVGEWKYEAPAAMEGYNSGFLAFTEKDGKLSGTVKLNNGSKIQLQSVTLEKEILKFNLYVEGSYISVNTKVEGNKLSGTVATPDGNIELTAKKIEKK